MLVVLAAVLSDSALAGPQESCSAGPGCCRNKVVGNQSYVFHTLSETLHKDCLDKCLYTRDGSNPSELFCFKPGQLEVSCVNCKLPGRLHINITGQIKFNFIMMKVCQRNTVSQETPVGQTPKRYKTLRP